MGCPTSYLMPTYPRVPITMVRGDGVWLHDDNGNTYLDALSGVAVTALGHAHPAITQAIIEQAEMLIHTAHCFQISTEEQLAQRLCELSGLSAAFFCNSGAEANETAIKLCRLYAHQRGQQHPAIIVMDNAFHGRSLATLTASGYRRLQAGFEPLIHGFIRAPYNDLDALHTIAQNTPQVVAVMVEPIQGHAGVNIPDAGYLKAVRELCDEHDWLLVLDEVQSGIGRTGKMFAYEYDQIQPDILTLAKSLGNGIPIGACCVSEKANIFKPGSHGSTNGGNPLATRVGLAVLQSIEQDNILDNVLAMGDRLLTQVQSCCQPWLDSGDILEIRARGLMIGIDFAQPCTPMQDFALAEKLIIAVSREKVIRLLPPLIIAESDCDEIVRRLRLALQKYFQKSVKV